MTEPTNELQFDRATYATPGASSAAPCGGCKTPLVEQYWKWHRLLVCGRCREGLEAKLKETQSGAAFRKALLQGGGVALACGIGYAILAGVTKAQFALATIGIAIVVAKVVRQASGGVSGRKFQVLAVALTYAASTMGYAPGILKALSDSGHRHESAATTAASGAASSGSSSASPAPASGGEGAPAVESANAASKPVGVGTLLLGVGFIFGVMLAAPFLEIPDSPLGAIIVAIGLWSAWRRTQAVPLVIEGPFRVAPAEASSPAA